MATPKLDPHATKLLRLVAQLTSPGVEGELMRSRFNRFPVLVMDDFNLPPEARLALVTMKFDDIGKYITGELFDWGFPLGEFPEPDPQCYIPPSTTTPPATAAYNMPNPQLKAIRPETGLGGTKAFEFTLYGEGLLIPSKIDFIPTGAGSATTFDPSNSTFTPMGTFRCGRMKVLCDLPSAADKYEVKITDQFGGPNDFLVPGATGSVFFVVT